MPTPMRKAFCAALSAGGGRPPRHLVVSSSVVAAAAVQPDVVSTAWKLDRHLTARGCPRNPALLRTQSPRRSRIHRRRITPCRTGLVILELGTSRRSATKRPNLLDLRSEERRGGQWSISWWM